MIYSQLRTLISMAIVLGLAISFLWGSTRVFHNALSAAPAVPTATLQPVIDQPGFPTATPGSQKGVTTRRTPTATPPPTATPAPSPTPHTPPKVFVVASELDTTPVATLHISALVDGKAWCRVRNSALPPGTRSMTFYWTQDIPQGGFLNQFSLPLLYSAYTDAYQHIYPGKFRCDVIINAQTFGSAHFSVVP